MINRTLTVAGVLAGSLFASGAAMAASGIATGNVNLRSGPGTGYSVITTIPAGAPMEIFGCSSWCQVGYAGTQGYVSANYVGSGERAPTPYVYVAPAPVYSDYYYGDDDYYDYGYDPGPSIYFGLGGFRGHHRDWGHRGHWDGGRHHAGAQAFWWRHGDRGFGGDFRGHFGRHGRR